MDVVKGLALVVLGLSIGWVITNPGWEPLIVLVGSVSVLAGSYFAERIQKGSGSESADLGTVQYTVTITKPRGPLMRVQSEVPLGSEHNRPIDFEGKVEPFPPQGLFLVRQMTSRTLADGGEREVDYMFVHKAELSTDGNWKYSMWFQIWPGDVSATYTVTAIAPRAELAYLFQHHWDVRLSMDEMQREMEAEGCKTRRRYPRLPDEMARRFKKEDHKGQVTVALHRSGA